MGTGAYPSVDAGLCGDLHGDLSVELLIQEPNTWFSVGMIYTSYVHCQLQQPAPGARAWCDPWDSPAEPCRVTPAGMSLQ